MFRAIIFLSILLIAGVTNATIIYVPSQQPTIQAGIDAAFEGDTVMVAPGTYTGVGNYNIAAHGKAILICSETGSDNTIIDVQNAGDGFHFDGEGEDTLTVIQGFTVTNAQNGVYLYFSSPKLKDLLLTNNTGYGIYSDMLSAFVMYGCRVTDNPIGIHIPASMPFPILIDSCVFEYNTNYAIEGLSWNAYTIKNCGFTNNGTCLEAFDDFTGNICTIDSCVFTGNYLVAAGVFALKNSHILSGQSGVLGALGSPIGSEYSVVNCTFENLTGTVIRPAAMTTISDCVIRNNLGTVLYAEVLPEKFTRTFLSRCQIRDNGGGIYLWGSEIRFWMTDCQYINNAVGVSYTGTWPIYSSCDISGCTFGSNATDALTIRSAEQNATITNTLVAFNEGYGISALENEITVTCTDVYGNTGGNYGSMPDPTGTNGNISADPLFCDAAGGDYRLQGASPCLPENNDCGELMGALNVGCLCCDNRGDINRDHIVDPIDVVCFVEWLWASGPAPVCMEEADIDGSEPVDPFDLLYFVQYMWNSGPAPAACP